MTCENCPQWRGLLPPLGFAAILISAVMIAFECGRYHRSPADMLETVRYRLVQPEWQAAEPNHVGTKGTP